MSVRKKTKSHFMGMQFFEKKIQTTNLPNYYVNLINLLDALLSYKIIAGLIVLYRVVKYGINM